MASWIHADDGSFSGFDLEEVVGYLRELKTDTQGFVVTTFVILLRGGHRIPLADEYHAKRLQGLIRQHFDHRNPERDTARVA